MVRARPADARAYSELARRVGKKEKLTPSGSRPKGCPEPSGGMLVQAVQLRLSRRRRPRTADGRIAWAIARQ
eukprot:15470921-Alexandrium_andersonii.AAC.1